MQGTVIYAPSTFEERGAAVSFTTPLLSQTRVRMDDRQRLEVLIPSFSEGKGIYVVPWKVVPEMVSMTVHDRYLHDQIVKGAGCSPHDIRSASLRAARCGLAGPQAVKAAREAIATDEECRTLTNLLLIVEILKVAGLESLEVLREGLRSDRGEAITREYMSRAAGVLEIDPNELYRRVADLANVASPVGLVHAPEPGRLRKRLRELAEFRDSVRGWADEDESDTAPVAAFCADVATHTLEIGEKVLVDFDGRLRQLGGMIRDWNRQMLPIRRLAWRLSWLVDGWDFVIASWRDAMERERQEQRMTVNETFRVLPLIPTSECRHDHADEAKRVLVQHRRSVRAYEDWRTGRMDMELVHHIEAIKAKAAA